MEATIAYWGYIEQMDKIMETTTVESPACVTACSFPQLEDAASLDSWIDCQGGFDAGGHGHGPACSLLP